MNTSGILTLLSTYDPCEDVSTAGCGPPLQDVALLLQNMALHCRMWPSTAGCGPPLQDVALLLQNVALHCRMWPFFCRMWPSTAGCGPPLQDVALHCRMWPSTAGCGPPLTLHKDLPILPLYSTPVPWLVPMCRQRGTAVSAADSCDSLCCNCLRKQFTYISSVHKWVPSLGQLKCIDYY